ncbi:lasso RiPP family leader peptide-containing protein [Saccharopolyspora sp. CA-218241]
MQDYIVPELTEVGEFSDDTLGGWGHGWDWNHRQWL